MDLGLLAGLGFAGTGEFGAGLLLEAAFLGGRFLLGIWKTGKGKEMMSVCRKKRISTKLQISTARCRRYP